MISKEDAVKTIDDTILLPSAWKKAHVRNIIIHNVFWAVWVAFLHVPIVQEVFLLAVQLKMINELCIEYGIKFSKYRAKAIVLALLAGLGTGVLIKTSLLKMIPLPSGLTLTVFAGAVTYAIGKVFERHFESGGTFLDFKAEQYKTYFAQMYQEGKDVVIKKHQPIEDLEHAK
jgi:uncharacterized protein (DUF697 family)